MNLPDLKQPETANGVFGTVQTRRADEKRQRRERGLCVDCGKVSALYRCSPCENARRRAGATLLPKLALGHDARLELRAIANALHDAQVRGSWQMVSDAENRLRTLLRQQKENGGEITTDTAGDDDGGD